MDLNLNIFNWKLVEIWNIAANEKDIQAILTFSAIRFGFRKFRNQ